MTTRATDTEQQASEWIIRSEAGEFTDDMQAEMGRWLQNPCNRVTYIRIKEAWRRANRVRGTRPLDGNVNPDLLKDNDLTFGPQHLELKKPRWPFRVAAGAAVILISYLIFAVIWGWGLLGPSKWSSYTTTIGGYENVSLPDGTVMQLNTDTEVQARLTSQRREIRLVRGEVLVKVKPDYRPFLMRAGDTSVKADPPGESGGSFVVRLRASNGIDLAVTQGSVLLASSNRFIDMALGRSSAAESTIDAGQTASVRPEGIHVQRVSFDEINRKLSWTQGFLLFQGETLTEVTDEFNRYNRKHLIVTDPGIADRRIGGAFQSTDPESFVSALRKSFGIRAEELATAADPDAGVIRLTRAN
jgi:transmembrane sensor